MLPSRYFVLALLLPLAGCGLAVRGPSFIQLDAKDREEDIRRHNGYYELKAVTPGTAKLVTRTVGNLRSVDFDISTSGDLCKGFDKLGVAYYQGRGIAAPWVGDLLAKTTSKKEFLSRDLVPGQPVVVKGVGLAATIDTGYIVKQVGDCGPVYTRFTPVAGHAYLVQFHWSGDTVCKQTVVDATDPDKEIAIEPEPIEVCAAK